MRTLFEEAFLLHRMMITEKVTMITDKADQGIVGIRTCFHCIKNRADALVDITDLTVVAGAEYFLTQR